MVLTSCDGMAEGRHPVPGNQPQRLEGERLPPRGRSAGVQERIKSGVAFGNALEPFTGQEEVPVRIDVVFVEPPKPGEPERVQPVEEDALG